MSNRGDMGLAQPNAQRQAGFTIIETLLFFAVTVLLLLIIMALQSQATRDAKFNDSLDSLISKLSEVQREQFSSLTAGTGQINKDRIQFMTVVAFSPGSSNAVIRKCTTDRNRGPIDTGFVCNVAGGETYAMKHGMTHYCSGGGVNCPRTILFLRHHDTGDLKTLVLDVDGTSDAIVRAELTAARYASINSTEAEVSVQNAERSRAAGILLNEDNRINQIGRVIR